MVHQAAICKAYFTNPTKLTRGRGSALVSTLLEELVGDHLCILEITRPDGRFSLVLDADWADLGLQISALESDKLDEKVALPRSALNAVVAGWPLEWDEQANPKLGVHVSEDNIPHVSLSEIGARRQSSPEVRSAGN